MWLSHYTSSGLDSLLNMDSDLFLRMLDAALKVYEESKQAESKIPQYVIMVEPAK